MRASHGHGVVGVHGGCCTGQLSADPLMKHNREMMSIHREASQRAGRIMNRAECKVTILQYSKLQALAIEEKGGVVQP